MTSINQKKIGSTLSIKEHITKINDLIHDLDKSEISESRKESLLKVFHDALKLLSTPEVSDPKGPDSLYSNIIEAISSEEQMLADTYLWSGVQKLFDTLPFYAMMVDCDHHILFANKQICTDLDLKLEEIVGKFCPEVIHGVEDYPGCPLKEAVNNNTSIERDFFDETTGRWGRSSIFPTNIKTHDGRHIYFHMFTDITTIKEAESALRRERELTARIMETSPGGIILFDDTGTIKYANAQAEHVLELSGGDIVGCKCHELVCQLSDSVGQKLADDENPFDIVFKTGQPAFDVIVCIKTTNGIRFLSINAAPLFSDSGQMEGVVATIEDVTRRVKAEVDLKDALKKAKEEKAKADAILSAIATPLSIQDREFKVIYQNQAKRDLIGEHVGARCFEAYEQRDDVCPECPLDMSLKDGQVHQGRRQIYIDDKIRIFDLTTSPVFDADNNIYAAVEISAEVTQQVLFEQRLQYEYNRAQQYLDLAGVIIIALDKEGRISLINKKGCEIIGLSEEELIGKDWFSNFIATKDDRMVRQVFRQLMSGEIAPAEIAINPLITASGKERLIYWHNAIVRDDEGNIVGTLSSGEDITEKSEFEEALQDSENRYRRLVEFSPEAIAVFVDEAFAFANSAMARLIGVDNPGDLIGKKVTSIFDANYLAMVRKNISLIEHAHNDVVAFEERYIRADGTAIDLEVIAIPLADKSQNGIQIIARDITGRKKAEQDMQDNFNVVKQSLESLISSIGLISESRDVYTAGHQQGVSRIASAIAKELGVSKQRQECIRVAGLLHDIGKISVPAEILSRPGPISENEYNLVKVHSQAGYDMLKRIKFPIVPVADIIKQHHERMDGSGYPDGLKGNEILLEARILAVADVIEAMTSRRPYRGAFTIEEALSEIESKRNVLYDPIVVDACIQLFTRILQPNEELIPA